MEFTLLMVGRVDGDEVVIALGEKKGEKLLIVNQDIKQTQSIKKSYCVLPVSCLPYFCVTVR